MISRKENKEILNILRMLQGKVQSYQQSYIDNKQAALGRKDRCHTDRDIEKEERWVQHWTVKLSANHTVDQMLTKLIEEYNVKPK